MDLENINNDSSSESEESADDSIRVSEADTSKRAKIREKLSHMSFEELQKLKEKIGAKVYNEVVLGVEGRKPKTDFKRVNKNRPREMSSKIRVRTQNLKPQNLVVPSKKVYKRDPRFDPMCGNYDEKTFKDDYKFVNDIRKREKGQLEKELLICVDPERKKQIKLLIQRISNQIREQEKRELMQQQRQEERKEIKEKLKKGERPIFKKKSEKKVGELLNKYEELKKSNKLQKHITKRQKKGC